MVISAVSIVPSFEASDDTDDLVVGESSKTKQNNNSKKQKQKTKTLYASLRHIDVVRSRTKAKRGKSFSTAALSKQK